MRWGMDDTWRRWYAWRPVRLGAVNKSCRWAWLETVERRTEKFAGMWFNEYREIKHEREAA